MNGKKFAAALLLALSVLLALSGCKPSGAGEETPPASLPPSESVPPSDAPSLAPEPGESEPAPPEESGPVLEVDGQEVAAAVYESSLGYSITYPPEEMTLLEWDGGETFESARAKGTYLAVSRLAVSNIDEAVAVVQFEYAVEDEPTGFLFGSAGYAGVRLEQQAGGLTVEYILVREGDSVFLLERAVFTGGEELQGLLQAMLDSFTIL